MLPAFIYHDVEAGDFERDLEFLEKNGYQTLTTDEYVRMKCDDEMEKAVLLTFDDARRNFFDVAFPLLQKYHAKATLFVPTRWVDPCQQDITQMQQADLPEFMFMKWDELLVCARSELVDVQSHAHRHALIYSTSELIGFCTPELIAKHDIYDWPMRHEKGIDILGPPPLGTPIYESLPLLSAQHRLLEDDAASDQCRQYVTDNGGGAFFTRSQWPQELRSFHSKITTNAHWTKQSPEDFVALVESEFNRSNECFCQHLGYLPQYLAYPWMLGSGQSLEKAAQSGIKAVFGVGIDYRRVRRHGGPLPAFGRTKCDWLRFMPGEGRTRLRDVVPGKIRSFFDNQHLAH